MSKRLSECCDQWDDLQTMMLADNMEDAQFAPLLNNCSSLEDFECKVKDNICDKIDADKMSCENITDEVIRKMALAALATVDVNKLVQVVLSCFEPQLHIFRLESRINRLCKLMTEKKNIKNERETTEPAEGEYAAFDIATKFDKDELDIDSEVDYKNKKDAWTLRLVYNDGSQENLSLVKPKEDKPEYTMTSDKDKLKVKFGDSKNSDKSLEVPQTVIDHIAKHIEQAEENNNTDRKDNDRDLAQEIAFDIKNEFPNYDMDVIEGDVGDKNWNIQIVYKDGTQDTFNIIKVGKGNYVMKSKDGFVAKYSLDELKDFPKKLSDHIKNHANKSIKSK